MTRSQVVQVVAKVRAGEYRGISANTAAAWADRLISGGTLLNRREQVALLALLAEVPPERCGGGAAFAWPWTLPAGSRPACAAAAALRQVAATTGETMLLLQPLPPACSLPQVLEDLGGTTRIFLRFFQVGLRGVLSPCPRGPPRLCCWRCHQCYPVLPTETGGGCAEEAQGHPL